jgi:hypothetical protein
MLDRVLLQLRAGLQARRRAKRSHNILDRSVELSRAAAHGRRQHLALLHGVESISQEDGGKL